MNHRARKRFGQNFLHDPGVIQRIIQVIGPQTGDKLVEIGPGQGAITLPLLKACHHLHVIELDRDLIAPLAQQAAGIGELVIHQNDALRFDFSSLADGQRLRIVGNLPYNISTPLLFHLLSQSGSIQDMHFMLQKEVVERMAASPGGSDYGRLSVMIQYHCQVQPLFRIGPGAFKPAPKVDSAFVRLTPWSTLPVTVGDYEQFKNLVRQAFSQRRKTLRNTLKTLLDENAILAAGVDPGIRPEHVTLEQYAALATKL
jgi:16S rRNA (adenine1518-N6/adenine1519-N6)-dimethyltransferase